MEAKTSLNLGALEKKGKTIGIMTCGGDCPGLNPVIRAAAFTAIRKYGWKVLGIEDSMLGLIRPEGRNFELTEDNVKDIITRGGTILGSDNASDPFRFATKNPETGVIEEQDVSDAVIANYKKLGLDALICIGGDGTMKIAKQLQEKGNLAIVGVPKTIDNDLGSTDYTFGFNTAVQTISKACDKIQDTARSHDRTVIIEVMGRDAGWLALHGGIAGAAHVILLPEIPYDAQDVAHTINKRVSTGNEFSIVVIAEGAVPIKGTASYAGERQLGHMIQYSGAAETLKKQLEGIVQNDIRVCVLGYIQRGGNPSNFDRILGSQLGSFAVELIADEKWGYMAALDKLEIKAVSFEDACKSQKMVDPNGQLVLMAKAMGVCFGDRGHCLPSPRYPLFFPSKILEAQ